MTIKERNEKRNGLLTEVRQLMAGENITSETRTKADRMLAEANEIKADIERIEASAESEQRSVSAGAPPRGAVEQTEGEMSGLLSSATVQPTLLSASSCVPRSLRLAT
jgi:hypothetical protein